MLEMKLKGVFPLMGISLLLVLALTVVGYEGFGIIHITYLHKGLLIADSWLSAIYMILAVLGLLGLFIASLISFVLWLELSKEIVDRYSTK
jgi:hypothetical protein